LEKGEDSRFASLVIDITRKRRKTMKAKRGNLNVVFL